MGLYLHSSQGLSKGYLKRANCNTGYLKAAESAEIMPLMGYYRIFAELSRFPNVCCPLCTLSVGLAHPPFNFQFSIIHFPLLAGLVRHRVVDCGGGIFVDQDCRLMTRDSHSEPTMPK